jgi:beta-lactamase regulating signal transducer with metallopeptidase domain
VCLTRGVDGDVVSMSIGSSLFLIAVGAILYFAVDADISGLEISTIGVILMVIGIVGLVISLFLLGSWRERRRATVVEGPVAGDREYW